MPGSRKREPSVECSTDPLPGGFFLPSLAREGRANLMAAQSGIARRVIGVCLVWAIVISIPAWLVYSCISNDNEKRNAAEARVAAETAKFATLELARTEIEHRVAARVVRDGRTLTVTDPLTHTVYVVPVRSQWVVSCDKASGLSVQLGGTSPGEDGDAVTVQIIPFQLAKMLSETKCQQIAPILGEEMTRITYLPER